MSVRYTTLPFRKDIHNVFTVDLEDWFNFEFGGFKAPIDSWSSLENRVESVTQKLLDILNESQTTATFFILGWIAERYPVLVQTIADAGHEIGCHTYCHHHIMNAGPEAFRDDLKKAKHALQDATGKDVKSFRAPSFSIDFSSEWAFEILAEEGFVYDSSIFPAKRLEGGSPDAPTQPHIIHTKSGDIYEMPITVLDVFGKKFTMFGGGYFRLLPVDLVSAAIHFQNKRHQFVNFYIHPHDMDPGQPRMDMSSFSRFRRYVGLGRTERKLAKLLTKHSFGSMQNLFEQYKQA